MAKRRGNGGGTQRKYRIGGKQHIYHVPDPGETMGSWASGWPKSQAPSRTAIDRTHAHKVAGYEGDTVDLTGICVALSWIVHKSSRLWGKPVVQGGKPKEANNRECRLTVRG